MTIPQIFDRGAVRRHRDRAAVRQHTAGSILGEIADRLIDRLDDTTRRFTRALEIGGRGLIAPRLRARGMQVVSLDLSPRQAAHAGGLAVAADEEWLPFGPASFDLILAQATLHWTNDLPGALVQLRRALVPDGLFLGTMPVLGTLDGLREALTEAEMMLTGGAAPRVSPFADLHDCAALLQRAGFALPVADAEDIRLEYARPAELLDDLRAVGESNALVQRHRRLLPRLLVPAALAALPVRDGRVAVRLRLATLTGWAPGPGQPQPKPRGSATISLAKALQDLDNPGPAGEIAAGSRQNPRPDD